MIDKISKNRNKIYWLCQILGWGLFVTFNMFAVISFEGFNYKKVIAFIYFGFLGICFTHIYHFLIVKWKWINYPPKKNFIHVIISSLLIGIAIIGLVSALEFNLHIIDWQKFKIVMPVVGVINVSVLIILWSLIYFSIHYFENYQKSEIEKLVWEAAIKDFELKTLKSQLNPHFMFNALNSIRSLIEEDPVKAKSAITLLSNILRYSLRIEKVETVPFIEEIQAVKDYLTLEQIRFEERLKFNIDFDEASSTAEIPPMMIQTLVENGIKHGISQIPEGGVIEVSSKVLNSSLNIKIKNSGTFNEKAIDITKGYGISNTKKRLILIYNNKASFSLSAKDDFVEAIINIPLGDK